MAYSFTEPDVLNTLRGVTDYPVYQFIEIHTTNSDSDPVSLLYTNFDSAVSVVEVAPQYAVSDPDAVWVPDYIHGVSAPARTGDVTQEVQRIEFRQSLDYMFKNEGDDLISGLGYFHNARVVCSGYVFGSANEFITTDPIFRTFGLVKKLSATERDGAVILEASSTFGKLQTVKEMVTTPDSINKFLDYNDIKDTSFDNAGTKHDRSALEWGT